MERRKFIKLAGNYSLLLSMIPSLAYRNDSKKEKELEETLKRYAISAFRRFEEVWDFNDFWKRGNTFDACLVFTDAFLQQWPSEPEAKVMQQSVKEMLEKNYLFFNRFDPGGLWADDFGWWGLMALNARKHLLKMGEEKLAQKYLELSIDLCWEYKKNTAYDHTSDAQPVPHGCRNGDANGQSQGVKNTVTNVLLFLLSSRIYRLSIEENMPNSEEYLDLAWRQLRWFEQWFGLKKYEYLKLISPAGGLVQERPMAFFEGSDYTDKTHPTWCKGWVWTGDQGMLLQALTDMLAVSDEIDDWLSTKEMDPEFDKKKFENQIREYIQTIGRGIKTALVGKTDNIFREAPFKCSFGPEHGRDYLAGRGILMRYLGNNEVKELLEVDFDENIKATSLALWNSRNSANNQFQAEFTSAANDALYISRFKKLWGYADNIRIWETPYEEEKQMVCQSIGLDSIGAAIKTL